MLARKSSSARTRGVFCTGDTVITEVGSGTVSTVRLARCGAAVCSFDGRHVTRLDERGVVLQELDLSELGSSGNAWLETVTGNALGLYVTVLDPTLRVLFVPAAVAGHAR